MDRGTLGVVLRLSRLVGIAPVVLRPGRSRVSALLLLYGALIVTCSGLHALFVLRLVLSSKRESSWWTVDVMHIACALADMLLMCCGVLTAGGRMTRMAEHLEQLEQINDKCNPSRSSSQGKLTALVLVYLVACCLLRYQEFFGFRDKYFKNTLLGLMAQATFVFQHFAFDLLGLQLSLKARAVLATTLSINANLEKLIPPRDISLSQNAKESEQTPKQAWRAEMHQKRKTRVNVIFKRNNTQIVQAFSNKVNCETVPQPTPGELPYTLRRLARSYATVCDVISGANSGDGLVMLVRLACSLLYMEKYLYKVVVRLTKYPTFDTRTVLMLVLCVVLSLELICTVEPFHRAQAQLVKTNILINFLKCRPWDDEAVSNELDTFVRLLMLRRPVYSPLSMITLERALVVKLYGCLVTYLVIMLTYGPEVKE